MKAPAPETKRTRRYDAPIKSLMEILTGPTATTEQKLEASRVLVDLEELRQKENAALRTVKGAVTAPAPAPVQQTTSGGGILLKAAREEAKAHPRLPAEPPAPKPKRDSWIDHPEVDATALARTEAPLDPISASLVAKSAPDPERDRLSALANVAMAEHHIVTPINAPAVSTAEACRSGYDPDHWQE